MKIVVAKQVRLFEKDNKNKFKKNGTSKVIRERAVIEESVVKDSEKTYKNTGLLWIIDSEETAKRNKPVSKTPKKQTTKK